MASNSNIVIQLYPNQDQLLIHWLKAMQESRPRFASVYAREALHYYIQTGKYLNLGSVAVHDITLNKAVLSIAKDDILIDWMDNLNKSRLKTAPFARSILNKCIRLSEDGQDHLPDFIDIMQPRIALQQQDTLSPTTPSKSEILTIATEREEVSTAKVINSGVPASQPRTPKNKRRSSIIDKLGSELE